MVTGRSGVLIIRAYLETESSLPLRAEIRLTGDVSGGNRADADAGRR
jgi:hypothetical protein